MKTWTDPKGRYTPIDQSDRDWRRNARPLSKAAGMAAMADLPDSEIGFDIAAVARDAVLNDSQSVVDTVQRFGYWLDSTGRLHGHADWSLCTVAELPPRIAYSRLPVCQQNSSPPPADPLPRDDGELSLAVWRFGSEQRRITAVNRFLAHGRHKSACLQLAAQFDAVASWLRDLA